MQGGDNMVTRSHTRVSTHADRVLRNQQLNQARANNTPCAICGQPINYKTKDYNSPDAPTVDHRLPWRDYPHLRRDPGNLQITHRSCNASKGVRSQDQAAPAIGNQSRNWNQPAK